MTNGTAPSPRSNSAITVANGHYLVIHGGKNNFVLDDVHLLDLLTRSWMDVGLHSCLWSAAGGINAASWACTVGAVSVISKASSTTVQAVQIRLAERLSALGS